MVTITRLTNVKYVPFTKRPVTRTSASLLSLFGPLLAVVACVAIGWIVVLPLAWLKLLDPTISSSLASIIGVCGGLGIGLWLRLSMACWYAVEKKRDPNWGAIALFGIFGWLILWFLAEGGPRFPAPGLITTSPQSGDPDVQWTWPKAD